MGMVSAASKPDVISINEFYVTMDISKVLNNPNTGSTSSGRRKRSVGPDYSMVGNRVALTRFTVPQETLCHASLTTESGRISMDFRYGQLVSWDRHAFVRNISTFGENVFVLYKQEVANLTFRCSCIQLPFHCGGKTQSEYDHAYEKTSLMAFYLQSSYLIANFSRLQGLQFHNI